MKWTAFVTSILLAAITPVNAHAESSLDNKTWLQHEYERSSKRSDGQSSGSSSGRQALIETVIEGTPTGIILEYDLPRDEEGKANSGFWYFPARVIQRSVGMRIVEPRRWLSFQS